MARRREARVEARVARREEARARDGSPDTANLPGGGDAMGLGGNDSFAAAKQRRVPVSCLHPVLPAAIPW